MFSVSNRPAAAVLSAALVSPLSGVVSATGVATSAAAVSSLTVFSGLCVSAVLPWQTAAFAQDANPQQVDAFGDLYARYLSAATGGQYDQADQLANELIRNASGASKLAALRVAVEQGKIDPNKLVPLMSSMATEDAAGRLELRLLDAQAQPIKSHYADFAHFTRIARPDLAAGFAKKLLASAEPKVLLHAVEISEYGFDPIAEAARIDDLADLAGQLAEVVESAQLARAAEPDRIRGNIQRLSEGKTAFTAATARLRVAGSHAAPFFLEVLTDPNRIGEQPAVREAIIEIGRPLVLPLSAALSEVEAETAVDLAYVLGKIGYPEAAPAIKARLDTGELSAQTEGLLTASLNRLLAKINLPATASLADICLTVGERYYSAGTRGEDFGGIDENGNGLLWGWSGDTVRPLAVPGEIYADVLAMNYALLALNAEPSMSSALSLFIKSNLRRENRLPAGESDRSYPDTMKPASFYAAMAGTGPLLAVLDSALTDADEALALDTIAALANTTATPVVAAAGPNQPLQRALNAQSRLVRFDSALALARSHPSQAFPGSNRVVPVLTEAARQGTEQFAAVVASSQADQNALVAAVEAAGFQAIAGASLNAINTQLLASPGVDVIVTTGTVVDTGTVLTGSEANYRLSSAPIIAVTEDDNVVAVAEREARLTAVNQDDLAAALSDAASQPLTAQQAEMYALAAIDELAIIALADSSVFDIQEAVAALIGALSDERSDVALSAAAVLSTVPGQQAQQALAKASLQSSGELQLSFLSELAASATAFGNQLTSDQVNGIKKLVDATDTTLAQAAATVHGALALPTQSVVQMLVN